MLRSTDEIKILSLYLVHHAFHFRKAHNACNNVWTYHVRRNEICETSVYHEISGIWKNCRMKSCNVAHKIIEAVSWCSSCTVKINAVKAFHNVNVIWDLIIRNNRLAEFFNLYVLAVVLAYRNAWVDYVRDNEHSLTYLSFKVFFLFSHSVKLSTDSGNLSLYFLSFVLLTLSHKTAYLLAHYLSFISQLVSFCLSCSVFLVKLSYLVNKNELFVLKLLFDVFLDKLRICTDKLNIYHFTYSF